jgi:tetratricopeptide (TPR) repeat protein/tRNA A-37 threonylcarbamoyl transferase component Bud32
MISQTILHYRILQQLGAGGMGEVYLAEDLKLGRRVAIKLLPPEAMRDQKANQRFLREARSASALNHPNIVTIYAIEEADGRHFIVMEYVEGENLRARIEREPVDLPRLLDLGSQVADALTAAHASGLIHRDIKSANILITPRGRAKVLDFGLAKMVQLLAEDLNTQAVTLSEGLTATGMIVGTVAYMSPEQTRGEALDARSDIFSLGVVLYEAATGRLPFSGPSVLAILHEIATADPPAPSAIRSDLPREFDLVIERALAKDREQRYASPSELAETLRALSGSASVSGFAGAAALGPENEPEAFVGREPEMRRLDEFLSRAIAGAGRVVFLTGAPGIGKTALADEFLRRACREYSSLIPCRGRCLEQYGTGEAYLPFLDALGALFTRPGRERILSALRTYAPTWCLQFPSAFSTDVRDQLQRETIGATKERMLREMGDALGALAANSPVVLVLEDLHWADPSSIDLLRHLCQRIGGQRLLVVGTVRPEDAERSNDPLKNLKLEGQAHKLCEEIALGLLSEAQVASYLETRFSPNDFSRELAALIQRKTEGHPLFATSLAQFLAERGDLAQVNERWTLTRPLAEMDLEAPESVRSMIRKQIEALDEEDRRALQYASIEGEEFLSTVLAQLLGVEELEVEERLDRIAKVHRLIEASGEEELPDSALTTRYRFTHALYQNSLYREMVGKRRVLLHRRAGEQLLRHYGDQAPRIAAQLAMHFERGRDYGRAIEYLIQAGDHATQIYANAEADKHYSHALGLVEKLAAEEQTERFVSLYQKRGTVNNVMSRFDHAVEDFKRMLDGARAMGSPALEHAALNLLGVTLFTSHRMDEMLERTDEALRVADASGSEALRIETMVLIGCKHQCYGELAEAKLLFDEVIRVARTINHKPALASALVYRGFVHFFQSEYTRSEEALTEARDLALELRNGFNLLHCLFGSGIAQGDLGRMSEALGTLNQAIEMARRNGDHYTWSKIPNSIGWIHRELQNLDEARRHDQSGAEMAHEHHVSEAEANSLINLGYDYTHEGLSEKPLSSFSEVGAIFARDDWMRWRYNIRLQAGQAEYWLAQGNPEQAEEYARRLLETATHYEARKYIAVAHKLLAEVAVARGDWAVGEAELTTALDWLHRYPVPIVAWKTYAALGRLRAELGDNQAAREAFAQAAFIVNQIAANVDDEELRATFLRSAAVREVVAGSSSEGRD